MKSVAEARALLESEIVQVVGCTEPASVAFAFLTARRNLRGKFDPGAFAASLESSGDVIRNASTAMVPFLGRRGLRAVVAAGLASRADGFNLFPAMDKRVANRLLNRRSWLSVRKAARKGVYVKAILSLNDEELEVVIDGLHHEIRSVSRNGEVLSRVPRRKATMISLEDIERVVSKRDPTLESIARDFVLRQASARQEGRLLKEVSTLVRERMCGSSAPIMTIAGSGNHGLVLGVPFRRLYEERGEAATPAILFTLLAEIYMTGKRSRICEDCGLATKAGPALAAGLAYSDGADLSRIRRSMRTVAEPLRHLKCNGARASCGRKAEQVLRVIMSQFPSLNTKRNSRNG